MGSVEPVDVGRASVDVSDWFRRKVGAGSCRLLECDDDGAGHRPEGKTKTRRKTQKREADETRKINQRESVLLECNRVFVPGRSEREALRPTTTSVKGGRRGELVSYVYDIVEARECIRAMGTMPASLDAMEVKAPSERSREFPLTQVGHRSATTAVTVLPLSVLTMLTYLPQLLEACPASPP